MNVTSLTTGDKEFSCRNLNCYIGRNVEYPLGKSCSVGDDLAQALRHSWPSVK